MTAKIRILDPHCVNQIAAGEVIERPLSVIKELVENSLDAEAKKIEISVAGKGTSLIRVKDNGTGIEPEDLELAVMPHATSKIAKIQDLDSLYTLGFRGEALASIAAVSRLSIISRTADKISGMEFKVEGGQIISRSEIGCPQGTTVTVEDLFYNTPARLKFLGTDATEFGLISDMVSRLALARPDVAFTLRRPHSTLFNTSGQGDVLGTIASVMGNDSARRLLAVRHCEGNLEISGYISPPDICRSSRQGITFIVNGRVIRSKLLNTALKNGYHTLLPANMHPTAVLYLSLPPSEYDVNVHPAKLEIKFKSEKSLSELVSNVVRQALIINRPVSKFSFIADEPKDYSSNSENYNPARSAANPNRDPDHSASIAGSGLPGSGQNNSWEQIRMHYSHKANESHLKSKESLAQIKDIKVSTASLAPETYHPHQNEDNQPLQAKMGSDNDREPNFFLDLRPIGQLFNTYILATDDNGLYIIDQHAAHERIRYEDILEQYKKTKSASQMLLVPETVNLTLQEEQIVLAHFAELHDMGFILEHFGDRTYFLRGVPILNNLEAPARVFKMFIDEILESPVAPSSEKLVEKWIFVLACRSAIKAKDKLSLGDMEELIMKLGNTVNPYTCPHGRPTIVEITKKELDSRFGR